jgi:hypothetical protein
MHRTPFTRTKRWSRRSRRLRPSRTLENRLSRNWPSRSRPRNRSRCRRSRQRRFVHGPRPGLRHDHSWWRSNWSCRPNRRRTLHLRNIRWRRCRWRNCTHWRRCCRSHDTRRNSNRRRRCGSGRRRCDWRRSFRRNYNHRRRTIPGRYRRRRHHSRWRSRSSVSRGFRRRCLRRCRSRWRLDFYCGGRSNRRLNGRTSDGIFRRSFLLRDRAQNIARARDVRKVNLGLDAIVALCSA